MLRKRILMVVIATATIAAFSLGTALAKDIMVSTFTELANDYYKNWNEGGKQAVAALDCDYKFGTDETDVAKQVAVIENFMTLGAKMFFITCPDSSSVKSVAEMMEKNKCWMTNTWQTQEWMTPMDVGDHYVAYYAPDAVDNAYQLAKALFEKMGKKGRLIHVRGAPGSTPDTRRTFGVDKALKEYPEIKVVAREFAMWNRNAARKVMESLIVAHPEFEGVFGQNDSVGIGAMEACEAQGIKVPVTGIDGAEETMKLIQQGRYFASMAIHPSWQAGWAAVKVWDAAHGWKPTVPERMMYQGGLIVTKDNVDQYMEKVYKAKVLPYDWPLMSRVKHPEDWDPQNLLWPIDVEYDSTTSLGITEKPADVKLNQAYLDAKAKGEMEAIAKLYKEHWKKRAVE